METFIWIVTAIGLGAGLAMDACAASMSNGLSEPYMKRKKSFLIAGLFGFFQILMPILGYLTITILSSTLGDSFSKIFGYFVPWIALVLLLFLGIKTIVEGVQEGKENETIESKKVKNITFEYLLLQAVATSIDALSVGIIYGNVKPLEAYLTFAIVGLVTFGICIVAVYIGKKFGTLFANKATIAGGIILIGIGLEIFFTHWSDVVAGINALINLF